MTVDGNNALYWTREGAPLQERLCIGLLYLCSALIFLVLQISVIFVSNSHLFNRISFVKY